MKLIIVATWAILFLWQQFTYPLLVNLDAQLDYFLEELEPPHVDYLASYTGNRSVSVESLCAMISGKRVLFVGPESTFRLHSLWLHGLAQHEHRSYECKDPQFCTAHHVCLPEGSFTGSELRKMRFAKALVASGSSVFRYIQSDTLHTSEDAKNSIFTTPQIDSTTRVRKRETIWIPAARKADLIFISSGPIHAPASSYSTQGWSFACDLYKNQSSVYLPELSWWPMSRKLTMRKIVNAALHATYTSFLPQLLERLDRLSHKLADKTIIWHSTWFIQPRCPSTNFHWLHDADISDPWALYYNAQGKYFDVALLQE